MFVVPPSTGMQAPVMYDAPREARKRVMPTMSSGRPIRFIGEVAGFATVGNHAAIIPTITGRAWITGQSTLMLDPDDPWPDGYRIADTWPIDAKD